MRYVRQRILQLDEIKQQREFRKNEISLKLIPLWQRLSIDQQQQEQFMAQHHGLTSNDLQEYESELERMIELKEKRIGDFIAGARKEIARLWSILYFSDDERREFGAAFTDEYSDELLEEHESQISKLQLLVEDRKYMLERVDRHMKLIEEIRAFKATTNDPSRLLTKSHRDPGRLLREEKFRKRVSRELPKVERELKGALQEHYVTHGSHFLVYGEPYIEKIGTENPWSTNNVTSRYMVKYFSSKNPLAQAQLYWRRLS
ncbi:microtubule associated protein-domain-containing protein [Radiomyces spectabilis]|uniref:microtubule associated protein-domain-containing protein n=1 Tax=Radiomyces spectabilis TaxID=64574 RepID=UPI002220DDC0|nr:microtubule associated protein-domain-containing protein [Radiomyces spectabilis]KAI8366084.1 microtubule associated protein-domain-containing protein [Radiomyces spectabilis]